MFRLNRLTDYAVVVMMQMTHKPQEVYTAAQIAADTGIPLPTVAKLLNALARESLVASHRGALGGYTLSHSGDDITVAEIIQALEPCQTSLRRTMVEAESPGASGPRSAASASEKSPVEMPFR